MTDEENKLIEQMIKRNKEHCVDDVEYSVPFLINLIEKQSKEIEHQIEKRANQRNELAILNAKQIEFNKLVNTVNSYKGQFKRQQKEIEELKEDSCCMTNCVRRDKEKLFLEDKIKAKIEDIESQINDIKDNLDYEYNETMVNEVWRLENKIDTLQSLLEKEKY